MDLPHPQTMSHWPSWPLPVSREGMQATSRHPCGYLPGRFSSFRAFEAGATVPGEVYQQLLDAGFRRSGSVIYQPTCGGCRQCVPLRVPVETFRPTRSQRRVLRQNADLAVTTAPPQATREKWELYERYQREWHGKGVMEGEDVMSFITFLYHSPVDSLEFEYRDRAGTLLGVGITDLCPRTLSSVYFYFDPKHAHRSLGTFSALYEIQWARTMKLAHWYAGYWIRQCPTMSYKSRFGPAEQLCTDGIWRPLTSQDMA